MYLVVLALHHGVHLLLHGLHLAGGRGPTRHLLLHLLHLQRGEWLSIRFSGVTEHNNIGLV